MRLVPLFENNISFFYIMFYFIMLWIISVSSFMAYFTFAPLRKQDYHIDYRIIIFVQYTLFFFATILYVPILGMHTHYLYIELFLSVYVNKNIISSIQFDYYIHACLGGISVILFLIGCFFVVYMLYEIRNITHNANSKISSKPDMLLYYIRLMTIIVFKYNEKMNFDTNCWAIPCYLCASSFYLLCMYISYRQYYNKLIMQIYIVLISIYVWCNCVLLIGRALLPIHFDGSAELFILGVPLICLLQLLSKYTTIFNTINKFNPLIKQLQYCSEQAIYRYLIEFQTFITDKQFVHNMSHIIEYISFHEETCIDNNCPLKEYSKLISSNDSSFNKREIEEEASFDEEKALKTKLLNNDITKYFLLQHLNELYYQSIDKYPDSITIRLAYAIFLMDNMNKKNKAKDLLGKLGQFSLSIEDRFIIYRLFNLYNESIDAQSLHNHKSVSYLAQSYQYHYDKLNHYILKVSRVYLAFWSQLLDRTLNINNDLVILSNYGNKITYILQDIKTQFNILQSIKPNDHKVLLLYSHFLNEIVNNHKESKIITKLVQNDDLSQMAYDDDKLFINTNDILTVLNLSSDLDFQYIIASGSKNSFGIMSNVSLGICGLFGYSYQDLIGRHLNLLIPEFMHIKHDELLNKVIKQHNKDYLMQVESDSSSKDNSFKERTTYGKTQSKYIIPIRIKLITNQTESKHLSFFAKIIPINNDTDKLLKCTVLTDDKLLVQTFTSNSLSLLGLKASDINSSLDITESIKEFCEEFLSLYTDNESFIDVHKSKIKLLEEKYINNVLVITWKTYYSSKTKKKIAQYEQGKYSLNVLRVIIDKEVIGYVFNFTVMNGINNNEGTSDTLLSPQPKQKRISVKQLYSYELSKEGNEKAIDTILNHHQSEEKVAVRHSFSIQIKKAPNYPHIDCQFVPDKYYITFNPSDLSFVINQKPQGKIIDYYKHNLNVNNNSSTSEDNDSNSSSINMSNEEESEDNSSCSNRNSNNNATQFGKINDSDNNYQMKPTKDMELSYYKVNMSKIKYLIYDYKKRSTIEISDYIKISQVEIKKQDYHNNDINAKDQLLINGTSQKESKKNKSRQDLHYNQLNNKNGDELNFKIEASLNKLHYQMPFFKLSFISFIMILLLAAIILSYAIVVIYWLGTNIMLHSFIISGITLLSSLFQSNFFILEFCLLQNLTYANFYQSKENYTNRIKEEIMFSYNESFSLTSKIITSNIPLSQKRYGNIFDTFLEINVYDSMYSILTYNTSLIPAIMERNTAMYDFITENNASLLNLENTNFLFAINNVDNSTSIGLKKLISETLENEGEKNTDALNLIISGIVFFIIITIIAFERLIMVYGVIEQRKDFYLTLFFNIKETYIADYITKCNTFIANIITKEINEMDCAFDESSVSHHTFIKTIKEDERKSNTSLTKSADDYQQGKLKWFNNKEKNYILLVLSAYFLVMISLLISYTIMFIDFNNKIKRDANLCVIVGDFEIFFLQIYNFIRNYAVLIPINSPFLFYYKNMSRTSIAQINNVTQEFWKSLTPFNNGHDLSPYQAELLSNTFYGNLCYLLEETLIDGSIISSQLTCESFADNVTSYGLDIILSYYSVHMRSMLKKVEEMEDIYNKTGVCNPYEVYNSNNGRDISFMWIYLLIPAIDTWRNGFMNSIMNDFSDFIKLTIALFVLIEIVIAFLYLIYVRPKYSHSMAELKKTKNMLSLIPQEILYQILVQICN